MMDPFSAISLASAVVQFLDFSCKLITEGHELYKSSHGTLQKYIELERIAIDIRTHNNAIREKDRLSNSTRPLSEDEKAIQGLSLECRRIAGDLLTVLKQLKTRSPHGKWDSFHKALLSAWKRGTIEDLSRRLAQAQVQINSRLIAMMRSASFPHL